MTDIKATVAMPMYNADGIYWLAMEGLCRQEGVTFPWELIVIEERHDRQAGQHIERDYGERLKAVGCIRIVYQELDKWENLTDKWIRAFRLTSPTSRAFFLQAADCYSQPHRLRDSYYLISGGFEWVDYTGGHFYRIPDGKLVRYARTRLTNLDMAFTTDRIHLVPRRERNKGIDAHLYRSMRIRRHRTLRRTTGLDTDGHNNISLARTRFYDHPAPPFRPTATPLNHLVPPDIAERLRALSSHNT